jgi:hypothetical protein
LAQDLAEAAGGAIGAPAKRKFDMRQLWRVALWGLAASAAVTAVVYAGSSGAGKQRIRLAASELREALHPSRAKKPLQPLDAKAGQQLAETVRILTADRERLLSRIASLEHSVDDITGSIARAAKAQPAPPPAPPLIKPPTAAVTAPQMMPEARPPSAPATISSTLASIGPPAGVPVPRSAPAQPEVTGSVSKTQFGIDIGRATTIEGLRVLWTAARGRHASALEGLHPIVHLRENTRRPGTIELRLVAGPLSNAATAARLCANLTASGAPCQPALFDGQRLAAH